MEDKNYSFSSIADEVEVLRERVNRVKTTLSGYFVGKEWVIELMIISTLAQEPLLLVGKSGTGKSDLVVKFAESLGLEKGEYFEYMLTKFTEPNEILGPVDIQELKEGRYIRRVEGKLPTAKMAFLDEIFKSNSAILNTLLTIINERKYYQDGYPMPVELKMLFAATNTVPDFEELAALRDRFTLKVENPSVKDTHFEELVEKGVLNDIWRSFGYKPWAKIGSLEDFIKLSQYISYIISGFEQATSYGSQIFQDRERYFSKEVFLMFRQLLRILEKDIGIHISDRKVIKLYRLLRTRAFLLRGGRVDREDLVLLRYIGDTSRDFGPVQDKVNLFLKL